MSEKEKNVRKPKPSILDPYINEIKELYELGVTVTKIKDKINAISPIELSINAYHNFIKTRIKA